MQATSPDRLPPPLRSLGSARTMAAEGSGEKLARVSSLELAYETFGERADPAVLMIMGLGSQMIVWPEELCAMLADRGYLVIRFDNRDAGRSTKIDGARPPFPRFRAADPSTLPYRLADMAGDAVGLLGALGIEPRTWSAPRSAGWSPSGSAIDHPRRVSSLASIMSTTGDPAVGRPTGEALAVLMARPPADRDGYVERSSPPPRDRLARTRSRRGARSAALAERAHSRGYFPDGTSRQLAAISRADDRTSELGRVAVPTVVIHGADDPLIGVSGGQATAAAIPGAELIVIEGMGHDLPSLPGA